MSIANGSVGSFRGGVAAFDGQVVPASDRQLIADVIVTAAQFKAMYTTPVQIVASPGPGLIAIVEHCYIYVDYGTAASAAGGAVVLQYGNTAAGAGQAAASGLAAATVNAVVADANLRVPTLNANVASATAVNLGLFLSNQTAVFTTTDSTFRVRVLYSVIPSSN